MFESAALNEVHFSRLRLMARSPAHYLAYADSGDTPARRFGTCVHVLALGGDVIRYEGKRAGNDWKAFERLVAGDEYFVYDGPRRGKAWAWAKADAGARAIVSSADLELAQDARETQARRRAAGRYEVPIVTASEYDEAARCAEVVRASPIARELLDGETECPLRWSVLGRACAGQLDVLGPRRVVDLKTTTKSEPEWFSRHAMGMAYHAQLDWYAEGARANATRIDDCYIVAVETRAPYAVTCLRLTEHVLELGARLTRLWMERLLSCEASGEWPQYVQSIVDLDAPNDFELLFDDAA
jgi:hypothetical protein